MKYLIDTNVISEVRKGGRCDPRVAAWYAAIDDDDLYLSVLVLGEIRAGAERVRSRDPDKANVLESWLHDVERAFGDRVLPIDSATADHWGRLKARRSIPVIDGLLAATARIHGLTLVTRNTSDVAGLDVAVINPFVV